MSEADRIRLEERARLLSRLSEDVSEMVDQLSEKMYNPNRENKGQKMAKKQQDQRGSKSLSNLSSSDTSKLKYNKKPQKKNLATANQANQPNSFPPNPPSYNESVQQPYQMDFNPTPRFYSQPMVMNQPTKHFYPQTPGNTISSNPQQYQQQYLPQQQQYQPHQQQQQYRPHQQQYRPQQEQQQYRPQQQQYRPQQQQFRPQQQQYRPQQQQQQYRSQTQKQQQQQKPSKTSQFPTPLPRKSLQQANSATNVEKQTPSSHQDGKHGSKSSIDLNVLIRELSNFSGFYTDILNLSKIMDSSYNDVLNAIQCNSKMFSTLQDESKNKVFVELCPKIKLCQDHIGSLGCTKQKCLALHICLDFINEKCQDAQNCSFGHIWKTDHNNSVLKEFFLALLPNKVLCCLMKKVFGDTIIPEICLDCSTNEGQTDDKCNKLHICHSYVNTLGNCSDGINCTYNHNVRDPKCLEFFKNIGISSNESPRDLLKVIKDRCLVKQSKGTIIKQKAVEKISRDDQTKNSETSAKHKRDNTTTKPHFDQNKTNFCYQFLGNVVEPKICIEGIYMKCKFLSSGCKYLHCRHKTHWQFGIENKWYNFHLYHSQILDTRYSDANCDNVVLPKLNAKKVTGQQNALFNLMGNLNSKVDFKNMTIDCEGSKKIFSIRQLTTVSSVLCERSESTKFNWYFLENDGKWKSYGDGDSSSSIIEKAYLKQPSQSFNFTSTSFTYLLDFSKMTQENLTTKNVRQIKRRPEISQNNDGADKDKFELPKHWEKTTDQETYKMVMLSSTNEEYTEIRKIIALSLPMVDIVNIYRIQNSHLWKQFQNKQTELGKKYNDTFLNIQKLFHGIEREHLSDICQVNLEFRIHDDPSMTKPYGEGTYFYNSAGVASSNCKVDFMGNKTLLVAEVIIGQVAQGSSGMTRPPHNSKYNFALYDTTTDKVASPTVFVKYNRQEYYPAYVVEFK